jgi:spore maturation protein CgeB
MPGAEGVKVFLLGRRASITHWLEDFAEGLVEDGHTVRIGHVRDPRIPAALERALMDTIAARLAARIARFQPDLVIAVGGFHTPRAVLAAIGSLKRRPPVVGWVGDIFTPGDGDRAEHYDLIAYTDSALVRRHGELGLKAQAAFAPHAVVQRRSPPSMTRRQRLMFLATPTPGRRAAIEALTSPLTLYGRGWPSGARREAVSRRIRPSEILGLYATHLAALNIRSDNNVIDGLNQRNFQPALTSTPLIADDQADLPLCFEPGREVLVWRQPAEIDAHFERLRRSPDEARAIGQAFRHRVLAEHTYGRRLESMRQALGV